VILLDLTQLEYFLAVARLQHVSRAAEDMNVGQSTISMALLRLENELNVRLFQKEGRSKRLTPAGMMFRHRVETIFRELSCAKAELINFNQTKIYTIALAVDDAESLNNGLNGLVGHLRTKSNIRLRQELMPSAIALKQVLFGEADFALTVIPSTVPELVSIPVMRNAIGVLVGRKHWAASRKSISLEELEGEMYITMPEGTSFRNTTNNIFSNLRYEPNIIAEAADLNTLRKMVAYNLGISFATDRSWRMIASDIDPEFAIFKELAMVSIENDIDDKCVYLTYLRNRDMPAEAWFFFVHCSQHFADEETQLRQFRAEHGLKALRE
jgi:DNA-binding transcriptional LysR family regulator